MIKEPKNWEIFFSKESNKDYYKELFKNLEEKYKQTNVFPKAENIFKAFEYTSFGDLKVVLLGQDPYHKEGQAQGLSFSTPKNIKNPPSMVNILKEINTDLQKESSCTDGDLTPWAKEGVLLLNTILTVQEAKPKSHHKLGWEIFVKKLIKSISDEKEDIIFILWGNSAIKFEKIIDIKKHHIIKGVHPSPLSSYRGFFGCKHFSLTNDILKKLGKEPINW